MVRIGFGLIEVLVAGPGLWAATGGAPHLGLGGDRARRRRRALLVISALMGVHGLLQLAGGLVEVAR
jgi:hypothetical protein